MTQPNQAIVGIYGVSNVATHSSPHTFVQAVEGKSEHVAAIKPSHVEIRHISDDEMEMEFDLVGTCAPIANTLRRVMMEEVPTMACERVCLMSTARMSRE